MFAKLCPAAPWFILTNVGAEVKCRPLNLCRTVFAKSTDSIQTPVISLLSTKQRKQARHGNSKKKIAITNYRTATGTVLVRRLVCVLGTDWRTPCSMVCLRN